VKCDCVILETAPAPPVTVVLLHGYAMQPEDLAPFVSAMGLPGRFLLPRAALAAEPGGRGWWAVDTEARAEALSHGARDLAATEPAGRAPVRRRLAELLMAERQLAPTRPCVLVGFSQGGMLACDTLLHEEVHVDALALLSSSCIDLDVWRARRARLAGLRSLVAHGRSDGDLAFAAGERLRDFLVDAGASVAWLAFDGGHQIPLPVWRELRKLIRSVTFGPPDLSAAA
jgi:phospholipase/carboxylesterase